MTLWVALMASVAVCSGEPSSLAQQMLPGDAARGWRVFHEKKCLHCHAVWGQGGKLGPDLGRTYAGHATASQLAGVMWNHIPKMNATMRQIGYENISLSEDDMADIFAFLYFIRHLDEPGDAAVGRHLLDEKGCTFCHTLEGEGGTVGPELTVWGSYVNPIVFAQRMWEHAPSMEEQMSQAGLRWPVLEDRDVAHIIAYVASAASGSAKQYLRPGSPTSGAALMQEKGCLRCHAGSADAPAPDLSRIELPKSLSALAVRMWNHSPEMTRVMQERDVERPPLTAQEMADIISYLFVVRYDDRSGNPEAGRYIFRSKHCAECHSDSELATTVGPPARQLGAYASPVSMAHAMWNHGPAMMEQMTEAGLTWPVFTDREMVDLLAFLESVAGTSGPPR